MKNPKPVKFNSHATAINLSSDAYSGKGISDAANTDKRELT